MARPTRSRSEMYRCLPARVDLRDTIGSVDTRFAPDPEGGRNTDRDFLVRYGLGI